MALLFSLARRRQSGSNMPAGLWSAMVSHVMAMRPTFWMSYCQAVNIHREIQLTSVYKNSVTKSARSRRVLGLPRSFGSTFPYSAGSLTFLGSISGKVVHTYTSPMTEEIR